MLTLRIKLGIMFGVPFIALLIISYIGLNELHSIQDNFEEVLEVDLPLVTLLDEMKLLGARLISSSNELLLDRFLVNEEGDDEESESGESGQIIEAVESYHVAFNEYQALVAEDAQNDPIDGELLANIESSGQELLNLVDLILEANEEEDIEALTDIRSQLEDAEVDFLAAVDAALKDEDETLELSKSSTIEKTENSTQAIIFIVGVAVVLTLIIPIYIFQSIAQSLISLRDATLRLQKGDLTARATIISDDEIGLFANTFNEMADSMETSVTEIKAAQEKAEYSDRVKSAFLASMSHELRTPLNAVINFTKFVAKGDLGPVNDDQKEVLHEVVDSAKHLLNLINDVLDMSKIEAGSLNLFVTDNIILADILQQVISTGKTLIQGKPVQIKTEIAPDLPVIRADHQRIVQIMLNLISNSCKFTDEGSITIRAVKQADDVVISVIDTGSGIAKEDQASVFEAFKQTSSGLRQGGGTGLGMPITKSLVEAHHGTLELESEVGRGTTVTITLPIKSDALQAVLI